MNGGTPQRGRQREEGLEGQVEKTPRFIQQHPRVSAFPCLLLFLVSLRGCRCVQREREREGGLTCASCFPLSSSLCKLRERVSVRELIHKLRARNRKAKSKKTTTKNDERVACPTSSSSLLVSHPSSFPSLSSSPHPPPRPTEPNPSRDSPPGPPNSSLSRQRSDLQPSNPSSLRTRRRSP